MRRIAWLLLLIFAFTIPWEYSLDFGEPLGNVARVAGILALLAAIPAVFQTGRVRVPGPFLWLTVALFLWFCLSSFWSIDSAATVETVRAYFQDMMVVWLLWEIAESPADLRDLMGATVAGAWVLVILTFAAFRSPEVYVADQIRFAAYGQDPNDVARYLDLAFPLAALLFECDRRWIVRLMALGFLPAGLFAVLLTASREGFVAALIAAAGSATLLLRGHGRRAIAAVLALPVFVTALWLAVPSGVFDRLATIPQQLQGGDLNQRLNIWTAGWKAFAHAPVVGAGAGSFVTAARTAPMDTAHNTALSIAVSGGLCALFLVTILAFLAVRSVLRTTGALRIALVTSLAILAVTSLVATVEESRTTWVLLATIAFAGRLAEENPHALLACFSVQPPRSVHGPLFAAQLDS